MHSYVESIITAWNNFCMYLKGVPGQSAPQSVTNNANFQVIETVSKVIGRMICKLANHTVTTDSTYTNDKNFRVIEVQPETEE